MRHKPTSVEEFLAENRRRAIENPNRGPYTVSLNSLGEFLTAVNHYREWSGRVSFLLESIKGSLPPEYKSLYDDRIDDVLSWTPKKIEELAKELFAKYEQADQHKVDGPAYQAGRLEGQADIVVQLRKIVDPDDVHHWNWDGVRKEVIRLANRSVEQHTLPG